MHLDPVYQKFIAKTGMMDDMYDVNVYFIPVLTGTNVSFATSMKNKFKENTQADLRQHVLFCNENSKNILRDLNLAVSSGSFSTILRQKSIYKNVTVTGLFDVINSSPSSSPMAQLSTSKYAIGNSKIFRCINILLFYNFTFV